MEFTLEQCERILKLLKRKDIKFEEKTDIFLLFINTLNNCICSNCKHCIIIPSYTYCTENKCELTGITSADCSLINNRIEGCPYKKYEDETKEIIYKKVRRK